MSRVIERLWPYVASLAWVAVWYFFLNRTFPKDPAGLLASTGTAAAVLVGFLTTANAIVLSMSHTEVFKRLAAAKYTNVFYDYFYEAIVASMALVIISVVGFFLDDKSACEGIFPLVWMVFSALSLTLFARVNHLLFGFIKQT